MDGIGIGNRGDLDTDALLRANSLIELVNEIIEGRIGLPAVDVPQCHGHRPLCRPSGSTAAAGHEKYQRRQNRQYRFALFHIVFPSLKRVHQGHQIAGADGAIDELVDEAVLFRLAHPVGHLRL